MNEQSFYPHAVAIQTLLKHVSGDTHWADRLGELLADYPNLPLEDMGFPENWRQQIIWHNHLATSPSLHDCIKDGVMPLAFP